MSRIPTHYADDFADELVGFIRTWHSSIEDGEDILIQNDPIDDETISLMWELIDLLIKRVEEESRPELDME